jgi:hypothetical protein
MYINTLFQGPMNLPTAASCGVSKLVILIPTNEQQRFIGYIGTLTLICNAHKKKD